MNGTEVVGIILFLAFTAIGVVVPTTADRSVPILIFAGIGLFFGLPVFIWGLVKKIKDNKTNTALSENPTIIMKDISLGHYEERQEYVGGSVGYMTTKKWIETSNSANGWTLRLRWISGYNKTIKYARFHVSMYNDVGDLEYCTHKKKCHFDIKTTGPISKGVHNTDTCENLLYTVVNIHPKLTSISVDFMDGTSEEIPMGNIKWNERLPWK